MELSVSNDFLSLFLPETSEFSSDDLLQELKIYIFKMMNITVESLIQEQINNDYENTQLKKRYKELFSERIQTILDITSLHKATADKIGLIRASTVTNLALIEQNNIAFNEKVINEHFGAITEDIQRNKDILNPSSGLLDLLSLPQRMLDCFSHNAVQLYLEYRDFINGLSSTHCVVIAIKAKAFLVNELICALMQKLIAVNYKFTLSKGSIYALLSLQRHSIFTEEDEVNAREYMQELTVLFYQIACYLKQTHSVEEQLAIFKETIVQSLYDTKSSNQVLLADIRKRFVSQLVEEHLADIFRLMHSKGPYTQAKETIEAFLFQTQILPVMSNECLVEVDEIAKEFLLIHLTEMISQSTAAVKNYLLMTKDVKKLFSSLVESVPLRYEIAIVLYNNLYSILRELTDERMWRLKDKMTVLNAVNSHCREVVSIIKAFFDDNLFQFKLTAEAEKEFEAFKGMILNRVILQFTSDVYAALGLNKAFEVKVKRDLIEYFNDELTLEKVL